LLLPMHDPNPRVWNNIEQSLQREGLVPEGRMSRPGHSTKYSTSQQAKSWTPLGWLMALTAVIVFTVVLINYKSKQLPPTPLSAQNSSAEPTQLNSDDRQLISQLSEQAPDARSAYESNLRDVKMRPRRSFCRTRISRKKCCIRWRPPVRCPKRLTAFKSSAFKTRVL
jgi:hypothetical protein